MNRKEKMKDRARHDRKMSNRLIYILGVAAVIVTALIIGAGV